MRAAPSAPRSARRMWPFRSDIAVLLLIAVQPLESAVAFSWMGLSISKIAGGLCVLVFALDVSATRRSIRFDATHALLLGLLALGLLSSIPARSQPMAIETIGRYAGFLALYVVATQFVGNERFAVRIVWVLTVSSSVAAILATGNFFSGRSLLAKPTYGDPNDLGYILAATIPLGVWLIARSSISRIAATTMVFLMLAGLALTLSRGAVLGLAVGVAWVFLTEPRSRKAIIAGLFVGGLALGVFIVQNQARWTTAVSAKERVASGNVQTRFELWGAAAILMIEHPVLGVGPGNFPLYLLQTVGEPQGSPTFVVHDAYLEVGAELGLGGLVMFLAFLMIQWRRLGGAVKNGRGPPGLASAVRTSLIVGLVGAVTLSEEFYAPIWIAAALGTLLWFTPRSSEPDSP
jgi:putative inorganic carbon (HCO3(-)) transporter